MKKFKIVGNGIFLGVCENYGKCDIFIESNALLNCELCSGGDIVGVKTISFEDIVRNESDSDLTFPGLKKKVEKLEKVRKTQHNGSWGIGNSIPRLELQGFSK